MRKMYIIMAMVVGLFAMSCNDDFTPPATLAESFRNAYPNAVDVEWERERGHRVAEFKLPGVSHDCEAWFTKSGNWYSPSMPSTTRNFPTQYARHLRARGERRLP